MKKKVGVAEALFGVVVCCLLSILCCPALSLGTDLAFRTMKAGGIERTYYYHLPPSYESSKKLPVVFVLHGGGKGEGDDVARMTGYNALADREGFIVVYPNGIEAQWNDGRRKKTRNGGTGNAVDDVGFLSMLIDRIVSEWKGDASRVYVTGLSNGGMMTFRLGCEITPKLAAIAPVIANMPDTIYKQCRPLTKLPVLVMNGTRDPLVPWDGGSVGYIGNRRGRVVSTNESVGFWVDNNGCGLSSVRWLPDRDPADRSRVKVSVWSNEKERCDVVLYMIEGGGHTLPGSNIPDRPLLLGRKNNDIDGPEVIWSFFRQYKRRQDAVH